MPTALFRGLPSTAGIADYRVRQVADGIIENLRTAGLQVSSQGIVYSGSSEPSLSCSLENVGGQVAIGKSFTGNRLKLRTLKQGTGITLTDNGNYVTIAASGSVTDTFKLRTRTDGSDTEGFLSQKLVSYGGGTVDLLEYDYATGLGRVKSLTAGENVTLTETSGDITIAVAAVVDDHLVLGDTADTTPGTIEEKVVRAGVGAAVVPMLNYDLLQNRAEIRGLEAGDNIGLNGADDDKVVVSGLGKVRLTAAAESSDYLQPTLQALTLVAHATGICAVVDTGTAIARMTLGNSAPLDLGEDEGTVAEGNHTHDDLALPAATEGDVLYYTTALGWHPANLAGLILAYLVALSNAAPDATYRYLTKTAAGALGWGPLKQCTGT